MHWNSYISRAPTADGAIDELLNQIDDDAHFASLFTTSHHTKRFAHIAGAISDRLGATVVGCNGMGVVGEAVEIEDSPGVSLLVGTLPNVSIKTAHTSDANLPDNFLDDATGVVVLADPFSSPTEGLLSHIDRVAPDAAVFGGLASGGLYPGAHALFDGTSIQHDGAVCVAFSGDLRIDTVVAQGCTPIGERHRIKKHTGKLITELDSGKPADVLSDILRENPGLLDNGLFVGLYLNEEASVDDLLVRTFMGADPNSGAIAINEPVHDNQIVQFQVRDRDTSSADVETQLAKYKATGRTPAGALLFTCIGRGADLYDAPHHDTSAMKKIVGDVPVGGFFCNGEIGRVGSRSFVFGYTSSFAFFRSK